MVDKWWKIKAFRVGGYDEKSGKISLYTISGEGNKDGGRVCRNTDPKELKQRAYNKFKIRKIRGAE